MRTPSPTRPFPSRLDTTTPAQRGGHWPAFSEAVSVLGFWSLCPSNGCQRARACIGDTERCGDAMCAPAGRLD